MNMIDRAQLYNLAFPKYPPLHATDRWIYGMWMIGNNYRNKQGYYGEYPPSYLKRILSMFPDIPKDRILHLFSGSLDQEEETGITFDINPDLKPHVVGDAHKLSEFDLHPYLILADPPYTEEDAEHYGQPMIRRNTVLKECAKILISGTHLVWLDQVLPMYSKKEVNLVGTIGLIRSTNHRFRVVSIFEKV